VIWEYGPSKETIVESIWDGRGGIMPAWGSRLSEPIIKALAVFVFSLGGGEK
jgi:cytochrome c oxidase cbb3-type subunit 3